MEPRETDTNALIINAQKLFRPTLGEHIEIETCLDERPRASAPEEVVEAAAPSLIEGGMETILVVEDDALVRKSVTTQIQSLGYQTISVASGAEALAVLERGESFDLLFTDVIMPGSMNGRELAEEVVKRRPGMKVLFTSGYTEDAIFHHGRLDPGVLLLAKPYSKAEIARMIRHALTAA